MRVRFFNHPLFTIIGVFLFFIFIALLGAGGYMYFEGYSFIEAIFMTVITVSTVGFQEVRPLSDQGMIFTILLIMVTFFSISFSIAYITRYLLDGKFRRHYNLYKMKQKIDQLSKHVIICGFGRNGQSALTLLHQSHVPAVVIEKNAALLETSGQSVEYYLAGDATSDEILTDAGIMQAQALIVTLPNDSDNVFIVLTARALNPSLKIISRASSDSSVNKMKIAGATNVIMPDKIGGTHMATLVMNPDVKEFLDYLSTQSNTGFQIVEVLVKRKLLLADIDAWKNSGATILGIKSNAGDYILNPPPATEVFPGDRLITMGSRTQLQKMEALAG